MVHVKLKYTDFFFNCELYMSVCISILFERAIHDCEYVYSKSSCMCILNFQISNGNNKS
jgi:hypothetical protein